MNVMKKEMEDINEELNGASRNENTTVESLKFIGWMGLTED